MRINGLWAFGAGLGALQARKQVYPKTGKTPQGQAGSLADVLPAVALFFPRSSYINGNAEL
jgi:hypothetical protein